METGKISSVQMSILLYPTIIATAILTFPSMLAEYVGHQLWIIPIVASSLGFITIFISVRLYRLHPGKTVIQGSEEILGKFPGKVVSFFILLYLLQSSGEISRAYSEFIVTSFLFKTPQIVVIGLMVFLCAYCIYGGVEVLARISQLLIPFFILPILILLIFLGPDLEFRNILPLFDMEMKSFIKAFILEGGLFAEFFLILFLLPFLQDEKKAMKHGMFSVISVMMTLLITNLITLFVLGTTTAFKTYPLMNVSRYVSLGGFFENMEAVVMAVWISGAFVKISVFFYAAVISLAQWLNLSDYRPIIWPTGILVVQLAFWALPNTMEYNRFNGMIFPFYSIIIQILIPLLLLIIGTVKQKKRSKQVSK
ncbi:endospore germination permease [Bacillus sp. FJAT-50079]|uniref:GerAB/ArcD/ProY family transporter n=1 Tax=Bacillus sp. FJAT-50079 TaxID=2833577 RepID=UPI001BC98806|nr:endospore germination permease [Bacillus sp. FJAT-50079]MBS4206485.1 endospore germination permease [Bacillus sp. FJAT-50079]